MLISPVKSGIYTLPLVLSLVVASFISGFVTQKIGYYVPAMYLCPCLMSVGLGLMNTLTPSSSSSHWIGYQFLSGFGLGCGLQICNLVVQRVLPFADMPIGVALMFFLQQLGGCIFTTVGEAILNSLLIAKLSGIPGLDTTRVLNQGVTDLGSVVSPKHIGVVGQAYNWACTRIFLAAMSASLAALLGSLGMEWKSIKKGRNCQDESKKPGNPADPA